MLQTGARAKAFLFFISSFVFTSVSFADDKCAHQKISDSEQFHQYFYSAMTQLKLPYNLQADTQKNLEFRHYVADEVINSIVATDNLKLALDLSKKTNLGKLSSATLNANKSLISTNPVSAKNTLRIRPITLVVVPGIFGEFIPNRAFEEILAAPSTFKNQFSKIVQSAKQSKNTNTIDQTLDLQAFSYKNVGIDELIHTASIDDTDGTPLVRIALLYTPFGSLETLGDVSTRAAYFNRRLQKFVNLTGAQDLVLVGYSRGVTFALDMVSQAEKNKLPYLQNVRGVVSYAGVVFGSSLTKNLMDTTSSDSKSVAALLELASGLQAIPKELIADQAASSIELIPNTGIEIPLLNLQNMTNKQKLVSLVTANSNLWLRTIYKIGQAQQNTVDFTNFDISKFNPANFTSAGLDASLLKFDLDPKGMISIALKALGQIGVPRAVSEYNTNIRRFKFLVPEMLTGVNQLREDLRNQWWQNHHIPTSITYYSLPAVMADPKASAIEQTIYDSGVGYNNSYDDRSLIDNHRKYITLSDLAMNDSQVSMAQSTFIPALIQKLNPAQEPINTKFLGVLGSHHWGITLQIVNPTLDKKTNPYPRKAALLALAAKISDDIQSAQSQCK